ncbi:MAG: hypothetical protein IJR33_08560 [Clostridia bacterium]|nr:hypothetical protein [Clostridia bacterium]
MSADNVTKQVNIAVTAREIDFVTRFARNWEHLREILGIMKPIKKEPGAVLKSKTATVVLNSASVGEGDTIPYSQATVTEKAYAEMGVKKYRKGVTMEAIKTYGYDVAVAMTDEAFLREIQDEVTGEFYSYLNTGTLTNIETTYQMTLAMAKGLVENKFKKLHRTATSIVGFANILDVYEYIGAASITVQNQFGFNYVKDFMGYGTIFLLADDEIARGTVIATPAENINLYYVDPGDSDFAKADLVFTTDGETNLIGFHTQGNYETAVSDSFAIYGLVLFAEYLDAISVVKYEASGSSDTNLAVASAAGTTKGTKLTISGYTQPADEVYYYKTASANITPPDYKATLDSSWSVLPALTEGVLDDFVVEGTKICIVSVNGSGQVVANTDGKTSITNHA